MVDHGMFGTAGENLYSSIFKHCYVSLSCFMMNKSVRYQEKKWHLPITGRVLLLSSFFFFILLNHIMIYFLVFFKLMKTKRI